MKSEKSSKHYFMGNGRIKYYLLYLFLISISYTPSLQRGEQSMLYTQTQILPAHNLSSFTLPFLLLSHLTLGK